MLPKQKQGMTDIWTDAPNDPYWHFALLAPQKYNCEMHRPAPPS